MIDRMVQTARYNWMIDQISDSLEITSSKNFNVREVLLSSNFIQKITDFFEGKGPQKLIFYFDTGESPDNQGEPLGEGQFEMITDETYKLNEKAIYFLRTIPVGKEVDMQHIDDDVISGEIFPNLLQQLNMMMSYAFQPMIEKLETQYWGECDFELKTEFMSIANSFQKELDESLNSMSDNQDKFKLDQAQLREHNTENSKLQHFEDQFEQWLQHFWEKFKKDDDEQQSNKDSGPKTELIYWKKVLQDVMLLMELTKTEDFQYVKNILDTKTHRVDERRNNLLAQYKQIDNILTERINEAKDNVKYLKTLDKFIEPLYSGTPEEITETFPALMNAIKMIHTISRYYNTSNKMTGLFVKITNQIILNCKQRILGEDIKAGKDKIWNYEPKELVVIFNQCISLVNSYKQNYEKTKKKASELVKSRHWDFDDAIIFQKIDQFVKRIKKLIELFTTIDQFNTLEQHTNLEGMFDLIKRFKDILESFKKKDHNLLEIQDNETLDKDYVELMQKIQKLDGQLQKFIDQNFAKVKTISYSLKLLRKFQKILHRDNIRNRLTNKYETILQNYGQEIDMIQKIFDEQKASPPILRNMPSDAGKIIWVRYLFAKLYSPIEEFPPNLIQQKEMKKYIDKYNLIGQNLIIYELYFTQSWCNDIDRAKACLQIALLSVKEEAGHKKLKVNFERDIQKLIREAKALDREGIGGIPESAKIILLQEEKFKCYYYQLDFIRIEYERVISMVKPIMKNLLVPHVEDLDLKLRPGMVTLTWTSMNIDNFIINVTQELKRLEQLVVILNDIIENRVENNLKMIGKIILVKLPEDQKPMSLDDFVDTQQFYIQEKAEILISKNTEIERSVDDLLHTVINYQLDPAVDPIDTRAAKLVKQYYFWYFYQALLNSTQRSLNQMKDRICGKRKNTSKQQKPFFEVNVLLEDEEVQLKPSLDDIQKAINRAATAVLSCSKKMMGWDQIIQENSVQENKESYYKIIAQDKEIVKVILLLTGSIQGTKNKIFEFLQSFEKYSWLWKQNITEEIKKFNQNNPSLQDYEDKLKNLIQKEQEIQDIVKTREIGAMALKTDKLIDQLKQKCREWKNQYAQDLHVKAKDKLLFLTENIKNLKFKLQKEVKEIDSLGQVMKTLEEIGKEQSEIELKFGPVFDMYNLLDIYLPGGIVDKEVVENRQMLEKKWDSLVQLALERKKELETQQGENLKRLRTNISKLKEDVQRLRKNFETEGPMVQGITPKEASDRLKRFQNENNLKRANFEINKIGEDLFGLANQSYPELDKTTAEIEDLNLLYKLYNEVNDEVGKWEEEVWSEIDPNMIKEWEEQILKFSDSCTKLPKPLKTWQAFKDLKTKIENYKTVLPFIKELKEPMIKDRHWEIIIDITKRKLNYANPDNFYFKDIIEAQLMDFEEEIEDIIDSAKKQDKIERTKNEIKFDWNGKEFQFKEWGNKKVPILSGSCIEEITEKLEEDISVLSGLSAMRHIGPFKEEVQLLQEMLMDIQATLELWVKVQILWTSLERVFNEGDICNILTTEAKKFKKIDKQWVKTIMEKAAEQKNVRMCCQNEIIKSILPSLQEELESCQKQLEKYLEMKRKTFPRFYFVSDLVLLKFLSQGSDPQTVQDDFDKLFDAISRVTFKKQNKNNQNWSILEIQNTMGEEKETIGLKTPVVCADYIEKWLGQLEKVMQDTIRDLINSAQSDIINYSFKDNTNIDPFIDRYPAQVVLIALQMKWTKLVQQAIEKKQTDRNKYQKEAILEVGNIMKGLTQLCKQDLTNLKREKVQTLVTIMVYLKDVTAGISNFNNSSDFDWQKYTRMYWNSQKNQAEIQITDWSALYSNEYLGVKERLCITPLTDRCYITLAQAMSMHYGGAPSGPAGTGKTETVKDLGRTLGIFVVVTNCSSEHRFTDMAKIFKGLCQSGLWGCFDEFNRIDLEVLSVVAMQVESITSAKKSGLSEFFFPDEVEKIKLVMTCGYFITMNPGYQGRQELPENLKVLFRGVTMMVPDREVIIKVKLASAGYQKYIELAKKFKVLYNLCEEQLSKQKHYDFGLRNILSVLRTAGNILREEEVINEKEGRGPPEEELILMRTLRDMNLSKLVTEDINLFNDLLKDTFSAQKNLENKTYPEVDKSIKEIIIKKQIIPFKSWILKIIQLYETSLVRHGFMLIGPTCSGKTTIVNTLIDSLSQLPDSRKFIIQRLNPKAFTSQEMYGVKNFAGEWTPGIFSEIFRKANEKKNSKQNCWIVCDGPVDAIWIENLNTVLDDNKVLTLANGDRLFMQGGVKMVFEAENLNNASPATVSRCGQIYVSQEDLRNQDIYEGWIKQRTKSENLNQTTLVSNKIPQLFNKDDADKLLQVLNQFVLDLKIIERFEEDSREEEIIPLKGVLKIMQVTNMIGGIIQQFQNSKHIKKLTLEDFEKIVTFSMLWAVGGSYELSGRKILEDLLKEKVPDSIPYTREGETMFDYHLQLNERGIEWKSIVPEKWKPPKDIFFSRLLLPTLDSTRAHILVDLMNLNHQPVLFIGGSGTAKTSSILMYANKFDNDKMLFHRINFSSATFPHHFQSSIETVCETKIRKGFGPKDGKLMTVFIDDLSMPEKNDWGDQITLEIVRELIEDNGFYRLEKNERGNFKYIENLKFLAAMNHPGGGRNDIPNRLKHHFFCFNMTLSPKIGVIFEPIINSVFQSNLFSESINAIFKKITNATIQVWKDVKQTLLPTPSKFHYLFNLRDVSRIFKGICQVSADTIKNAKDIGVSKLKPELFLISLWKHECDRVLTDKLVNEKDKQTAYKIIEENCLEVFSEYKNEIETQIFESKIMFCDFLQYPVTIMQEGEEGEDEDMGDYERTYEGIYDLSRLRDKCNLILKKFNRLNPQKRMDLVLFDDALTHLLKISRIIQMPRSSALLVGVGGSGKQSLTRFASFIGGQGIYQVQLTKSYNENQFKEDIKQLFDVAGHKGNPVTFILTDQEIKSESFLEFINMVLSTGEVPGLIPKDEKEIWLGDVRTEYVKKHKDNKEPTNQEIYDYFINRLRDNLHIVLCFSPVGNKFRERARKFPALFNECTIDWFLPWPEEALSSVADQFISDMELDADATVKEMLPKWMAQMHISVNNICEEYLSKMRRAVFVTPKSYLSFIKAYKKQYKIKFEELGEQEKKFTIGLQKIQEASQDIKQLEEQLKIEEQKVNEKKEQVEQIIVKLNGQRAIANEQNEQVSNKKQKIEIERQKIEKEQQICQKELDLSMPALIAAQQAANQITAKELNDLKPVLQKSAHIVMKYVVDAIQIVLYQKVRNDIVMLNKDIYASKTQDPTNLIRFFEDSWDIYGKQAFFDPQLAEKLQMMARTENENLINGEILELLEPYTRQSETWLSKGNAMNAFNKMGLIHDWMVQIEKFSVETRNVKPKRIALAQQQDKLNEATQQLMKAEEQLAIIQKNCAELDSVYKKNNDEKNELEEKARIQKKTIDQAIRLINSLTDEKQRWSKDAKEVSDNKKRLVGNVGVATAFISYCGPFNAFYRDLIANDKMIAELQEMKIPFISTIYQDLTKFLVDEATVSQWNIEGLPKDVLSIQNGIMVESSDRYPLLIDPQEQGTFWIKNKFNYINEDTGMLNYLLVNINEEKKFRDGLTKCVEEGIIFIIEGIQNAVDPILDPILEKNFIKKGTKLRVSLGGQVTDFNKNFGLFMTCKLSNPKFSPELSAKTTIIDFTVTQNGLQQQLLSVVLTKRQRVLEENLNQLMKDVTEKKRELLDLDKKLLLKLTTSTTNLLEDTELIDILNKTKSKSLMVKNKIADSEIKQNEINDKRLIFQPVAVRGSVLYFCIIEIAQINWMYNSSLNQFLAIYNKSIDESPKTAQMKTDVDNILTALTYNVYRYVNRGLFEKDKLTFILMVCFKVLITAQKITGDDVSLFLKAGNSLDKQTITKPEQQEWITEKMWNNVLTLSLHKFNRDNVEFFMNLPKLIKQSPEVWKKWAYEKADPEKCPIPEYEEKVKNEPEIGSFLKLCLIRSLREDRALTTSFEFIEQVLSSEQYTNPVTDTIDSIEAASAKNEPVLFLLSAGVDPTASIDDLAKKRKKQLSKVSLGEGQGPKAQSLIQEAMEKGDWVLLQNCHLGLSFMQELDNLLMDEEWIQKLHDDFRIWMSCEPREGFPLGLLQKAIKVTNEPPKGVKAGLQKTFQTIVNSEFLERIDHPNWRSLVYTTCFLHSIVQERRKFGELGWCIPYEYNYSDLEASLEFIEKYMNQLQAMTGITQANKNFQITFRVIVYIVCEIQYGGKITDNLDRELFNAYGEMYYRETIFNDDAQLTKSSNFVYTIPNKNLFQDHAKHLEFIEGLPGVDNPEIFGLNSNSDITFRTKETKDLINTIMNTRPKESVSGTGQTREEIIQQKARNFLEKVTYSYDMLVVNKLISKLPGPKNLSEKGLQVPLNIFLLQEIQRMSYVLYLVRRTLNEIIEAVDGTIIMTPNIVDAIDALFDGNVPRSWIYDTANTEISWLKPSFPMWFDSLIERNLQLSTWLKGERPRAFSLGLFFNPQGFLTAMKQEIVRANKQNQKGNKNNVEWTMDNVQYQSTCLNDKQHREFTQNNKDIFSDGVYLKDLYLEGCRQSKEGGLQESYEKKTYFPLYTLHVTAVAMKNNGSVDAEKRDSAYNCPVYKYPNRNDRYLIFRVLLNFTGGSESNKWKLRGVALLCSTDR